MEVLEETIGGPLLEKFLSQVLFYFYFLFLFLFYFIFIFIFILLFYIILFQAHFISLFSQQIIHQHI